VDDDPSCDVGHRERPGHFAVDGHDDVGSGRVQSHQDDVIAAGSADQEVSAHHDSRWNAQVLDVDVGNGLHAGDVHLRGGYIRAQCVLVDNQRVPGRTIQTTIDVDRRVGRGGDVDRVIARADADVQSDHAGVADRVHACHAELRRRDGDQLIDIAGI